MRNQLSVAIITKDEINNIEHCLESVSWADEIVVVDSGSTDGTQHVCREHGCKVIEIPWPGYGLAKKRAVSEATHGWILSIDADERVTEKLKESILDVLAHEQDHQGYRIRRRSYFMGHPVRFSGWQRDRPLRLFNRRYGTFNERTIHEYPEIDGTIGRLKGFLLHYPYPDNPTFIRKREHYTTLSAERLFQRGKKVSRPESAIRGGLKFFKMFILQGGFLDGRTGLLLASKSAYGIYLKYKKLWELNRESST